MSCPSKSKFESIKNLDVPIVCRKGVKTCIKHPMSNFICYEKISPSFYAFTTQLSCVEIPKNVQDALRVPEWKEAILEEMRALEKKDLGSS